MWWMVDVGFSHVLDEENLTPTQEKCLDLNIQSTNILFRYLHNAFCYPQVSSLRFEHLKPTNPKLGRA